MKGEEPGSGEYVDEACRPPHNVTELDISADISDLLHAIPSGQQSDKGRSRKSTPPSIREHACMESFFHLLHLAASGFSVELDE